MKELFVIYIGLFKAQIIEILKDFLIHESNLQ